MTAWSRITIIRCLTDAGVGGDVINLLKGLPTRELREICLEHTAPGSSEDYVLDLGTVDLIQRDLVNIQRMNAHAEVL